MVCNMSRPTTALLLTLSFLFTGCSGRVATYPVSGTVQFDDGEPVRIGFVEFRCPDTGVSARAKLSDSGAFSLGTFGANDGAPAGDYQVIIVQYFNAPPPGHVHSHADHEADEHDVTRSHDVTDHDQHAHDGKPDARIAAKFSDYSTSPLKAKVRSDADNKLSFVVVHPATGK